MVKAPSFEVTFGSGVDDKRLDRLERDMKALTKAVDKLASQGGGSSGGSVVNVVNKAKKVKKKNKQNDDGSFVREVQDVLAMQKLFGRQRTTPRAIHTAVQQVRQARRDRAAQPIVDAAYKSAVMAQVADAKRQAAAQAQVDQAFRQQMAAWDKLAKASNKQGKKTGGGGRRGKKKKDPPTPWGWVNNLLEGWNKADKKVGKIRTMTQRLKTAGGWFVETALMSPERTVGKVVLNVMRGAGPYGFAIATAITMIISSPAVITAIVKVLGSKGGPMNRDWRRLIEDEVTGILSLEEQKRRDLGLDGYIVSPDVGFKPVDESSVYNSQLIRDEVRLNKLSQGEKVQFSR